MHRVPLLSDQDLVGEETDEQVFHNLSVFTDASLRKGVLEQHEVQDED